jgi:hypothetical protein
MKNKAYFEGGLLRIAKGADSKTEAFVTILN